MPREERQKERRSGFRRRAETHVSGFDRTAIRVPEGVSLFAVKEAGVKKIDILGYTVGKGNPYADEGSFYPERTYFVHRGIGVNEDSYTCPAKTAGKRCPICEHQSKLQRSGDKSEETKELIKSLRPKERQLWNVYDYAEPDKGWQIWEISHWSFGKLLDQRVKDAEENEYDNFYDLDGLSLRVSFSEESTGSNTYTKANVIDFKARQPWDKKTLAKMTCLDDLPIILPYDKLKAIYEQRDLDDDEPEDDDPKPKPRTRQEAEDWGDDEPAPKPKHKPKPPADEDWDDEPPPKPKRRPEPEDDDEPAPKPKPKPKPPADEDWDDDEPAPKPRRRPEPEPEEGDEEPAPKRGGSSAGAGGTAKARKSAPVEDDDEPAPKPKPKAKPAEDEDWDNWD